MPTNAIVRKWQIKAGREIAPRMNQNAGGHAGFSIGRRTPQLEVTYETPSLVGSPFHSSAGIDPYQLFDLATPLAFSLQVGSVQYNRHKWTRTSGTDHGAAGARCGWPDRAHDAHAAAQPVGDQSERRLTALFD
jgi:hypothetical protein